MTRPLALCLVALACLGAARLADDGYKMANGQVCPVQGSATTARLQALDRDKNRSNPPGPDDVDTDVTLAAMLAPGDDETRFENNRGAKIIGYVVKVKSGSSETCNCKATTPDDRDTHIQLALSPDAPANQCVIVEVTPRLRLRTKESEREEAPSDWSTSALQSHGGGGVLGKWVEVTGWLLFDIEHVAVAENTNPGHAGNERATCWEIHPITDIQVVGGPPEHAPALAPVTLRHMQQAVATQTGRDPARKQAIADRIKQAQELFTEDRDGEERKK
jgi:hypothetical protein